MYKIFIWDSKNTGFNYPTRWEYYKQAMEFAIAISEVNGFGVTILKEHDKDYFEKWENREKVEWTKYD